MFAECKLFLFEIPDSMVVPSAAVVRLGEMDVVPLVKLTQGEVDDSALATMLSNDPNQQIAAQDESNEKMGIVELRQVELGYIGEEYTNILDGLSPGDLAVIETQQSLKDGMKVRVVEIIVREKDD